MELINILNLLIEFHQEHNLTYEITFDNDGNIKTNTKYKETVEPIQLTPFRDIMKDKEFLNGLVKQVTSALV